MRLAVAQATDLHGAGRRLDASYHASDGVRASHFIERWTRLAPPSVSVSPQVREASPGYHARRVETLAAVCEPGGVFIPGRFKRIYVDDPAYGERWLSPSEMLQADLSHLRLVSRKSTPGLENLRVRQGWILLSRSGSIGNLVYTRQDMDGLVGSDDIIRILPDRDHIPPGYLYTLLSSRLGKALIQQKTYGAVVPHIEAHHVTDLPIPRLDPAVEQRIHELIERAAALRVEANQQLDALKEIVNAQILGIPQGYRSRWPDEWSYDVKAVHRDNMRLDPFHYVGHAVEYASYLKEGPRLSDIANVHLPGQFKRMYVGSDGVPYLSGVDLYQLHVEPRLWLSPRQKELAELVIREPGTILVQADGQRYGLLGRPVYTDESIVGAAVSNHLVRIRVPNSDVGGYIFLFLSTEAGRRELIRHSYGTSIPTIPLRAFEGLTIARADSDLAASVGRSAVNALSKRTEGNRLEAEAQALLAEALGLDDFA